MKFLLPVPGSPLDPGSTDMLNAPFTGAGLIPGGHEMPAARRALDVCSNEEDPYGESADA
jgi:hypothetical protein